jgi:hypothetical protein
MSTGLKHLALVCVLAAATATAACGGGEMSVTGPSSNGGSSSSAGATIVGRINGGSGLASTTSGSTGGWTVTITGTNNTAPVDATGSFTLTNVPEGTLQLEFKGPGVSAKVTITVNAQDQIQIAVTINGNTAQVESQHRSGRNRAEVEGRITEIDAVARTIRVSGTLVSVPTTATVRRGSQTLQFADLVVGDKVEAKGAVEGTSFVATEVKIESDNRGQQLQERRGTVSALSGTCPTLTFTLGTLRVTTTGSTYFKDGACPTVQNGMSVEVNGQPQADGSLVAMLVKQRDNDDDDEDDDDEDDDDNDDDEDEAEIEGTVSALSGACPVISFTARSTSVTTTSATRFDDGCSAIRDGKRVEVRGVRQTNGSIVATRVKLED